MQNRLFYLLILYKSFEVNFMLSFFYIKKNSLIIKNRILYLI